MTFRSHYFCIGRATNQLHSSHMYLQSRLTFLWRLQPYIQFLAAHGMFLLNKTTYRKQIQNKNTMEINLYSSILQPSIAEEASDLDVRRLDSMEHVREKL
jgi:hypothetical protein